MCSRRRLVFVSDTTPRRKGTSVKANTPFKWFEEEEEIEKEDSADATASGDVRAIHDDRLPDHAQTLQPASAEAGGATSQAE